MSRGFDGFEIDDFRGSDFGSDSEVSRSPSSDWNKWTELHNIHRRKREPTDSTAKVSIVPPETVL